MGMHLLTGMHLMSMRLRGIHFMDMHGHASHGTCVSWACTLWACISDNSRMRKGACKCSEPGLRRKGCSLPRAVSRWPNSLPMHLFRLLVLALTPQHSCKVVLASHCGRMLFAQNRLPQPECLSTTSAGASPWRRRSRREAPPDSPPGRSQAASRCRRRRRRPEPQGHYDPIERSPSDASTSFNSNFSSSYSSPPSFLFLSLLRRAA
jgi:hypothetical protein